MNQLVIVVIVGFILVGGIASFSIYLQQDDALAAVERVINPNLQCLDKWDWFQNQQIIDPNYKSSDEVQSVMSEFAGAGCYNSFRAWMDESHKDWDQFIVGENNRKDTCNDYLSGVEFSDVSKQALRVWKCEEFVKQFD